MAVVDVVEVDVVVSPGLGEGALGLGGGALGLGGGTVSVVLAGRKSFLWYSSRASLAACSAALTCVNIVFFVTYSNEGTPRKDP